VLGCATLDQIDLMRRHFARSFVLLVATIAGFLHWQTRRLEAANTSFTPLRVPPRYRPAAALIPAFTRDGIPRDVPLALPRRLRAGETLGEVLVDQGLDPAAAELAIRAAAEHVDLRKLQPGERYIPSFDRDGALASLSLRVEGRGALELMRAADGWNSEWRPFVESRALRAAAGTLESSLEAAMRDAGAPAAVAYRMADVLQWDVDFNKDLQRGDTFAAVYEEVRLDQRYHDVGVVRAVVLENGGRRLEAYRFGDGYYDADGRPLQKLFLRSPLPYTRVTSSFSHRRYHPVLKSYRPHYGVDYGAPMGTPVRATAAGVVVLAGWDGGGGRTVKLRHPDAFLTAYLHLSRFAAGVKPGARVAQGDVIGYVGASGLATGPHLDYRVQHRGRWVDPTEMREQPAEPIAAAEMATFLEARDQLREGLASGAFVERESAAEGLARVAGLPAGSAGGS
jgi:murein DD-endopeptidase MepM/ murein hydrolase activator NlpD